VAADGCAQQSYQPFKPRPAGRERRASSRKTRASGVRLDAD
jgi:hypothetical protein